MKRIRSFFSLIMIAVLSIGLVSISGCSTARSQDSLVTQPTSESMVAQPTTEAPVAQLITEAPVAQPTTEAPVIQPTTEAPVTQPTTEAPVTQPTTTPVIQPTSIPNTGNATITVIQEALLADIRSKAEQPSPGIYYIDAATAKNLFDNASAIILDARYKVDWDELHIAGSLSLPVSSVWIQTTHPEQYIDPVTVVPDKDAVIITYCAPGCPAGLELAQELSVRGYHNLFVLIGGYLYWQQAGYPMVGKN
jgi:rhodanese-related sulfurtransferase